MTKLNPAAIDTPSRIHSRSLDKSRSTKASNRLLAFLVAVLILTAGVALGSSWQASAQHTAFPACSTLAPSTHHALCLVTINGRQALLAANGDTYALHNGRVIK